MKNIFGEEIKVEEEVQLPEEKPINVFDYVKSINNKKKYLGDDLSGYSSVIVSKALASYNDCLLFVAELNRCPAISTKAEYDYYYYGLEKANRFSEWYKKDTEILKDISKYYNISFKKAQEVKSLLTSEELKYIHDYVTIGITEK